MVPPWLKQVWVVSGVLINIAGQGMVLSFPYTLLPGLRDPASTIQVDLDMASWLSSSIGFSTIIGIFLASSVMEWKGRRLAHFVFVLPGMVAWIMIHYSTNVAMLLAGRILGGLSAGACVALGAVVIGEYTSPENRGIFLNMKTTATCVGITFTHIISQYYNWRQVALFGLLPAVITLLNILTWPESPGWLVSKKRYDESEVEFFWLRGRGTKAVNEFEALIRGQKEKMTDEKLSLYENLVVFFKKFTQRDFLVPLLIILFSFILLEACGRHTFPAYALKIIRGITGDNDEDKAFYYTISIDIITAVSASSSCVLVTRIKRRTLLFFSGFTTLSILCTISLYLFLASKNIIPLQPWIALVLLVLYFIAANLGCTPIPLALMGEIFPLRHRAAGTAIGGVAMSVSLIVALKMTPTMLESIQVHGTFAVYAAAMVVSLLFLYFYLPETKDRTLQDIEDYFNHGRFLDEEKNGEEMKMLKEKA